MQEKRRKVSQQEKVRPPIVAVLGHVDHGKTTLLDAIRNSNLAAREFGGITQHIGAYEISYQGKKITFIDTPGHEAFENLRSYGAKFADIALLVIAADEGVKPQTKEAIDHIREANIPFIVVISKMDLPQANPERVKKELAKEEVLVESEGGNVVSLEVSAREGRGISELLEMINLLSELSPAETNPQVPLEAQVIESQLDSKRGVVATVIVKNGTLKIGQQVFVEDIEGKIRSITDSSGKNIREAPPSTPVEILGLSTPPTAGSIIREGVSYKKVKPQKILSPLTLLEEREKKKDKVNIILKADFLGSLDAISSNFPDGVNIVAKGVGGITESDLLFAQDTDSQIFGFNVKVEKVVKKRIEEEKIIVKTFRLISELLDEVKSQVEKFAQRKIQEEVKGRATIVALFDVSGKRIAGLEVKDGFLERGGRVRILRDGKILGEAKILTLKHFKKDIEKAEKRMGCGASFDTNLDFATGDRIEFLGF